MEKEKKYRYDLSFLQYWDTYGDEEEILQATNNYNERIDKEDFSIEFHILTEETNGLILSTVFVSYYTSSLYPSPQDYNNISDILNNKLIHFNNIREYNLELNREFVRFLPIVITTINEI